MQYPYFIANGLANQDLEPEAFNPFPHRMIHRLELLRLTQSCHLEFKDFIFARFSRRLSQ